MGLDFITSQKGTKLLHDRGFCYRLEREGANDKLIWRCVQHTKKLGSCKGRIHIKGNRVVKRLDYHNHDVDRAKFESKRVLLEIKAAATTSTENPQNIIANACVNLYEAVKGQLPCNRTIKRTI